MTIDRQRLYEIIQKTVIKYKYFMNDLTRIFSQYSLQIPPFIDNGMKN